MKYLLFVLVLLVGCETPNNEVKDTGPVTVVITNFDYHQTLKWPNGFQKEFYHCAWDGTLGGDAGTVVDIKYTGNGETMGGCANIVGVKVISYPPDSREIEKENEKKHLKVLSDAGYYQVHVIEGYDDNTAYAKAHNFKECPATFQGNRLKDKALVNGLICDDKVVVLEVI